MNIWVTSLTSPGTHLYTNPEGSMNSLVGYGPTAQDGDRALASDFTAGRANHFTKEGEWQVTIHNSTFRNLFLK